MIYANLEGRGLEINFMEIDLQSSISLDTEIHRERNLVQIEPFSDVEWSVRNRRETFIKTLKAIFWNWHD